MKAKEAVVKRINDLLKQRGMVYNELANVAGITPSTIYSMMLPERKEVSINTITKICDGLDITLRDFFDDVIFDSIDPEIE